MASEPAWITYAQWNDAIAEVVFPRLSSPAPAYLDLEDEQLRRIGESLSIAPESVEDRLCAAVRATLNITAGRGAFRPHLTRLQGWRRAGTSDPPPVLALLAVFSLAAEHMARSEGLRETNFYGRLREALGVAEYTHTLDSAYRLVAEPMWGSLNRWLLDLNGRRGLPTAFALSQRFVGLALSQALVRQADRQRLQAFFRRFDLSPGTEVPPGELEPLLNAWICQSPSPATRNLERLWAKESARDRIAQAAAVALANWDGAIDDEEEATRTGKILLTLELCTFPSRRLKVRALIFAARAESARTALIHAPDGDVEVPLEPGVAGALDLGTGTTLDPSSTFEGVLRVTDCLSGAVLEHRPRRLMVFRRDALSNRLIETPQVMLGDDHVLVVHHQLAARVLTVLGRIARPGWTAAEDMPGLAKGWKVIKGVEIFRWPGDLVQGMDDLSSLIPITRTQLRLGGGLPLPGATRNKWHTWAPPEVRAVSEVPGFAVRLLSVSDCDIEEPPAEVHVWSDDGSGALIGKLGELGLVDGDYRVELWPDDSRDASSALSLRLRTADTPDTVQWEMASTICQYLRDPLAVLGAGAEVAGPVTQGAITSGASGESRLAAVSEIAWWTSDHKRNSEVEGIRCALVDQDSCLVTGHHHEQVEYVPLDKQGRPTIKTSASTCLDCGLTKKYSTNYYANRHRHARRKAAAEVASRDVTTLPAVEPEAAAQWDLALDGLFHTGGGRWSLLERLAMSIEPSALFVDHFARALETLGHIEVRRDPKTLQPIEWEVAPTALVRTDSDWVLTGYWSDGLQTEVAGAINREKAGMERTAQFSGPSRWYLSCDEALLAVKAEELGVEVARDAWRDLVSSLPALSTVVAALERRAVAEGGPIRWFDPRTTAWVPSADAAQPGAYRIGKYAAQDVIRTPADIEQGRMATSDVYLSKHAAVQMLTGRILVAYNRATEELRVPIGASLPGLYARAAVLASGLLPTKSGQDLVYHQAPQPLAQHLAHLLSH